MDKEKKTSIDFLSRFICTVYKPLYYIVLPLIFALILDIFTTINFRMDTTYIYWIILIAVIILIVIEYIICRTVRKKRGNLEEKQLTVGKKIKSLIIPLIITLILMVVIPFIHVTIMYNIKG